MTPTRSHSEHRTVTRKLEEAAVSNSRSCDVSRAPAPHGTVTRKLKGSGGEAYHDPDGHGDELVGDDGHEIVAHRDCSQRRSTVSVAITLSSRLWLHSQTRSETPMRRFRP